MIIKQASSDSELACFIYSLAGLKATVFNILSEG